MSEILKRSKIEYISWSINWVSGCAVDCSYCYMRSMLERFEHNRRPWKDARQVIQNPAEALEADLCKRSTMPVGPIMISTSHDPAMNAEVSSDLREIVQVLVKYGLGGQTLLLTKRPMEALAALEGIGAHSGLRIGTTLTTLGCKMSQRWEPGSEVPPVRLAALQQAATSGYKTWISMEPPLPGVWLYRMIEEIKPDALGWPWIVLGRMNYRGSNDELLDWAKTHPWGEDREKAVERLISLDYLPSITPQNSGYYIKNELRKA